RMSAPSALINLYDLSREDLAELLVKWDFKPVHAGAIWSNLYYRDISRISEMEDVPERLRRRLEEFTELGHLPTTRETHSTDGFTRKYLLGLRDQRAIETVLMKFSGRVTACVSSQVGCAMGCVFCATGQMGYTRHLTPGEIVAQVMHVRRIASALVRADAGTPAPEEVEESAVDPADETDAFENRPDPRVPFPLRNLVLMGMGEPLHNYDSVMKAIDIIRHPGGIAMGAKRITLSTVGVIPGIIRMADEARPVNLAVSLHGASQAERAALVPAARKWPLEELIEACRYFVQKLDRKIFFEWTLIEGKNDSPEHAQQVGELLKGIPAQVNLIPLNPTTGYDGAPTRSDAAKQFQAMLATFGLPSTVRQRRGIDIGAGCGQLAVTK
ncbi:MAG TPA: 23S rRNA (adenine(2503)-C(2))-methyltransferase RlmN, partial [Opitutaceae bacterium]